MRPSTKASSVGIKPSPSRPHPKCFNRGSVIAFLPFYCGPDGSTSIGVRAFGAVIFEPMLATVHHLIDRRASQVIGK
jgi:hypothetical protein